MKNLTQKIVDAPTLAVWCNLSVRRIHQFVELGMPKIGRGRFDAKVCVNWYVKFMQNALENKGAPVADDGVAIFRGQRARSLLASAELKEFELDKKRSSLVTRADADKAFAEFERMVRARISTVAAPLAKELRGETSMVMATAKIERALDAALTLIATVDGPDSAKNL